MMHGFLNGWRWMELAGRVCVAAACVSSCSLIHPFNDDDEKGKYPLTDAAEAGNLGKVRRLVAAGTPVIEKNSYGAESIHLAAENGHLEVVRFLLDHGANVRAQAESLRGQPIQCAAKGGHLEVVKLLVARGAGVNDPGQHGELPLEAAAGGGRFGTDREDDAIAVVKFLLDHGARIDGKNGDGYQAIHLAVMYDHLKVAQYLHRRGARLDARTGGGDQPIHQAEHPAMAAWLIANGCNVRAVSSRGSTPLHKVAIKGDVETARLLIRYGASPNALDAPDETPDETPLTLAIHQAWVFKKNYAMVDCLLQHGADPNARNRKGEVPLQLGGAGDPQVVALLLKHGAKVNIMAKDGTQLIHSAAGSGNVDLVKLCLAHGANVKAVTSEGWTPLHGAAASGNAELVTLCLARGAKVNAVASDGRTPLHEAALKGHLDVMRLLLDHGANPMRADKSGNQPIHCACSERHDLAVQLLLERGVDVNAPGSKGQRLLGIATGFWYETPPDLAKLLLAKGADVNGRDASGNTALHGAAFHEWQKQVKWLVRSGADVNATNAAGQTPLHKAAENGQTDIVKMLLRHGAKVDAEDAQGIQPIHEAALRGDLDTVKVLVSAGAKRDARTKDGRTPLSEARRYTFLSEKNRPVIEWLTGGRS